MKLKSVQLVFIGLVLAALSFTKLIPKFSIVSIVYAYTPQEILNSCYPNAIYNPNFQSCDAGGVQPGASCAENVGGQNTIGPECGCFGQNPSHTYMVIDHPTQCNDGQGNIQQFTTFECTQDLGEQNGQCGNPAVCNFWQDCEAPPGDGPHSGSQYCSGLPQLNGICALSPKVPQGCSTCLPKHEASVIPVDANAEYDPQVVSQGEPVNVFITATRPCKDATSDPNNPNFDPGQSLIGCKLVQPMTCDLPNPQDWKKCWAEYQCQAADKVGLYTATFTNNDPACKVVDQYYINPPKDCDSQPRGNASVNSQDIQTTTLEDDKSLDTLDAQGNAPPAVNDKLVTDDTAKDKLVFNTPPEDRTANPDTKAGVLEGIKGGAQSLACGRDGNALIRFVVQNFLGIYCPERVDLASKNTNLFYDQSKLLAQSRVPDGAAPKPAKADCKVQDVQYNGSSTVTEGNKKINSSDSSSKVIYTEDIPPQVAPKPVDINKSPMTAEGKLLNDNRPGDIDNSCPLKMQSLFPDGITRCTNPANITK